MAFLKTDTDDKLSESDLQFIKYLVEFGNITEAMRKLVYWELEHGLRKKMPADDSLANTGRTILKREEVQREYWNQMQEVRKQNIADSTEVMMYFTQVMRGEIKDQFGLDASLSDRTQAAKELAKRTIDMENRMAGKPDAVVGISLNWER